MPDASCLRSGCHETRLLSGRVEYQGIHFDHAPHLGELRRGKQLRCTSCHSQIVQGKHMAVTTSTCFLCHFKDEPFNEGLAACTRCHQIPEKEYDLGGGVKFTHELAYKKGVDCINCHADVIRGKGEVPRERCLVCHNRESDLARINDHAFMHAKHVAEHAINCLSCHLRIEHSFDKQRLLHAAGDCAGCHPNHHQEQIKMFEGIGGKTIPGHAGGMMVTRVSCRSCHRLKEVSPTGAVLWKASASVCSMCHEASEVERLRSYHEALRAAVPEIGVGRPRRPQGAPVGQAPRGSRGGDRQGTRSHPVRPGVSPQGERHPQHPLRQQADARAVGADDRTLPRVEGARAEDSAAAGGEAAAVSLAANGGRNGCQPRERTLAPVLRPETTHTRSAPTNRCRA